MARQLLWYDPHYIVEQMDGSVVNYRNYAAESTDQLNASAMRLLNEWVQWESVDLGNDYDAAVEILDKGDSAAALEFLLEHDGQRVEVVE